MAEHPAPPVATYRLQLGPSCSFADAAGLVDYLADLGISHLYLSPVLQAMPGSSHGYDVADPTKVSEALGGEAGLRALADRAHGGGLGLIVDVVPNHVGTGAGNPMWEVLLAEGQAGEGALFFDVDWDPPLPRAQGKVILPILGEHYGAVLERGDLEVVEVDGQPRVRYSEQTLPLSPDSREALTRSGGIESLRGTPGDLGSWHRLHALLEQQHYRLVHWRAGDQVVNYRRFFAINELAAVRVEDEAVFERTHTKLLELVADGVVDGLRVDHPDGLHDPGRYFARLAQRTGGVWTVAEKILHPGERLPDWPVAGTTGYDFCNDVLGLFVDPDAEERFDRAVDGGTYARFAEVARAAKQEVLEQDLAADFVRLSQQLWALSQTDLTVRDATRRDCVHVLEAALCSLDVYRTYVDPETGAASDLDRDVLVRAFRTPGYDVEDKARLWGWLRRVLAGEAGDSPEHLGFIARFQQLSAALMAKGVEDTAFYRYRRLLALNEVGGDPARFGVTVEAFHAANAERARRHPAGMLTTATHDAKRGEDTRLRVAALTELGERWPQALARWRKRSLTDDETLSLIVQTLVGVWPLDGEVTAGLVERVKAYLVKALREAGEGTDWYDPDEQLEEEAQDAVDLLLADESFRTEFAHLATAAQEIAMVSGLAQALLRCTAPGVPDIYQGTELWDDSLVDPDNRRPVDFTRRRKLLRQVGDRPDAAELWRARRDGRVKLRMLAAALRTRARMAPLAGYQPLPVTGEWADHVVAFVRTHAGDRPVLATVTPRLPGRVMGPELTSPLGPVWGHTSIDLPTGDWHEALTGVGTFEGGQTLVAKLLAALPVALLVAET